MIERMKIISKAVHSLLAMLISTVSPSMRTLLAEGECHDASNYPVDMYSRRTSALLMPKAGTECQSWGMPA